jgi:ribonucleoside-diphosphate reductase alpha chain
MSGSPSQPIVIDGVTTSLPFTENAIKMMKSRYLVHNEETGHIEFPEDMFRRVATHLASVESDQKYWASRFLDVMLAWEFVPAGRTLANAGPPTTLVSHCVVLHMEDSLDSIFETLKEVALLQQAGSGIGFPFHLLRPTGVRCKRTLGQSSGQLSFLRIYSEAFRIIQQYTRHGANMALMRVDHPDILAFIEAKAKESTFENFNFSISFTDEFMERVVANDPSPWLCQWKGAKMPPRRITRDAGGRVTSISDVVISAPELMSEVVNYAWKNGEPGCVFIDTVNASNPLPGLGPIECCNCAGSSSCTRATRATSARSTSRSWCTAASSTARTSRTSRALPFACSTTSST